MPDWVFVSVCGAVFDDTKARYFCDLEAPHRLPHHDSWCKVSWFNEDRRWTDEDDEVKRAETETGSRSDS